MSSSLGSAPNVIRGRGVPKCPSHQGKEIVFFCEDCDELGCIECAAKLHKRHALEELSDIVPKVKQRLKNVVNKIQQSGIQSIIENIDASEGQVTQDEQYYDNLIARIEKRNKTLKEELDKITQNFTNICRNMQELNSDMLYEHRTKMQSNLEDLETLLPESDDVLGSGSVVQVFDLTKELLSKGNLPAKPEMHTTDFAEGSFSLSQLIHLVGTFTTTDKSTTPSKYHPGIWNVAAEFTCPDMVLSINASSNAKNEAWVCSGNMICLKDHSGKNVDILDIVDVQDFCLSHDTGNLCFCSMKDNWIREIVEKTLFARFTTEGGSCLSICMTVDAHVVLGFKNRIIKYTTTGQTVCQTKPGTSSLPTSVVYPSRISECHVTRNLAVADWDNKNRSTRRDPRVSIYDQNLQLLYVYRGKGPAGLDKFFPYDAKYMPTGELVIAEYHNRSVLIVSGQGTYVQTVCTDTESQPTCICVQQDGTMWVAFCNKKVKILKRSDQPGQEVFPLRS